jgi:hypothetical protein
MNFLLLDDDPSFNEKKDENNAIMNVMNKEKISITSKADWLLKKCLLELALLKQNFDNRDQKFISRTNMNVRASFIS